jgi:hypothetical protein
METFGASAPLKELQKKFGFTTDNVIAAAKEQIASSLSDLAARSDPTGSGPAEPTPTAGPRAR